GAGSGVGDSGNRIVLTAGSGGHFFTLGQINGKSVQMVVDTGATAVSLSVQDAQRLGIAYQSGQPMRVSTANGVVPAWVIKLSSVRVGDVSVHGVDAVVSAGSMPYVLLGNTFLTHFQMTRANDQMVLEKRY
ncbi:MAG: TIGR02281 family clan AA aspartic protease, partial [Rhodoferax sp.]